MITLKLKNKNFIKESPISVKDIGINKIVVYNKLSFGKQGFKYLFGYKDFEKSKPLCIPRPQIIYKRHCYENRRIYFFDKKRKRFYQINGSFRKKLGISSKKNLIVNLYIVNNI